MRRKAVIIDWTRPRLRLYVVADAHVGSEACDEQRVRELARIVADDEDALVVGLGDYIEAIAYDDWRFSPTEMAEFVTQENLNNLFYCQAAYFAELFEATKGKWAMAIDGNHETYAARRYHTNATSIIADRMGCPYQGQGDEAGWLIVRMKSDDGTKTRDHVRVYCQHGWGGGELRGGLALKMERLLYRKDAHAVLMGHLHRPMAFPVGVESVNRRGWETRTERWGVISYPLIEKHGYLARKGGNAPPAGYAVLTIERNKDGPPKLGAELRQL